MATTVKTAVRIRSEIYDLDDNASPAGDAEITDISADGTLSQRDGVGRLCYTEHCEGGSIDCELLIKGASVRLKRRGAVLLDLELKAGERTETVYSVPPYRFDMTVLTKRAECRIDGTDVGVELEYDMSVGGAQRRVKMTLSAKAD